MESKLEWKPTALELEYRTKHYYEFRALKHRALYCTSCGNILSSEADRIFSHPILKILQCRQCYKRVKSIVNSEQLFECCAVCSDSQKKLLECKEKNTDPKNNCRYKFCQACIKRNLPLALDKLSQNKWKCLACRDKSWWNLRGLCALVTESTVERTKREKVLGNNRNEREDAETNLRNKSHMRNRRELKSKELTQRLRSICDEEDSSERISKPANTACEKNDEPKMPKRNVSKQIEISSEDSDIQEVTYINTKKSVAAESSSSSELSDDESRRRVTVHKKRKLRANKSASTKNSTNDDSDEEFNRLRKKRRKSSTSNTVQGKHLGSRGAEKKFKKTLESIHEDDSHSDNSMEKKKLSRVEREEKRNQRTRKSSEEDSDGSAEVGKRTRKSSKETEKLRKSERDPLHDLEEKLKNDYERTLKKRTQKSSEEDSDGSTEVGKRTRKSSKETEKLRKSRRDHDGPKKKDETLPGRNKDIGNKKFEKRTKLLPVERLKLKKTMSDSSSGKEFCSSKLFRNTHVVLKRMSDIQEDCTRTPVKSAEEEENEVLSEDQTFGLKNNVSNFFKQLKKAAAKLLSDVETANTQYCMKKSLRVGDINSLILETKNVVSSLKECVNQNEIKMEDYYERWCRKTKVRNVLRMPKSDSKGSAKKSTNEQKESKEEEKSVSLSRSRNRSVTPAESITVQELTDQASVSECDSEAIFSNDESKNLSRGVKPKSPVEEEKTVSSKIKNDKSETAEKQSSDDMSDNEKPASNRPQSDRNSVDLSDVDIFETSAESPQMQMNDEEIVTGNAAESSDDEKSTKESKKMENKKKRDKDSSKSSDEDRDSPSHSSKRKSRKDEDSSNTPETTDDEKFTKESKKDKEKRDKDSSKSSYEDRESPSHSSKRKSRKDEDSSNTPETTDDEKSTKESKKDKEKRDKDSSGDSSKKISRKDKDSSDEEKNEDEKVPVEKSDCALIDTAPILSESINEGNTEKDEKSKKNDDDKSPKKCSEKMMDKGKDKSSADLEKSNLESSDGEERQTPVKVGKDKNDDNDKTIHSQETVINESNVSEVSSLGILSSDETERVEKSDDSKIYLAKKEVKEKKIKKSEAAESPTVSDSEMQSPENERSNEEDGEKKNLSKSGETNGSSLDALLDDEILKDLTEPKSTSSLSRVSSSFDVSETENLEARDKLLLSSNSEESSTEEPSTNMDSALMENERETSPESSSSSKEKSKKSGTDGKRTEKIKKKTFRIENKPELMADKKLTQRCEVRLRRLPNRILRKHAKALAKSRDYVDSMKLKRLVDLDALDKKKKTTRDSDSSDNAGTSKNTKKKSKSKASKEQEETLLDHLEKVKAGQNIDLTSESDLELSDSIQEKRKKLDGQSDDSIIDEMDNMMKKRLLENSDSDDDEARPSEPQEKEDEKKKTKKEKKRNKSDESSEGEEKEKKKKKRSKSDESSEDEDNKGDKSEKSRWRNNKLLTLKISDSDSDVEKEKFERSQEKLSQREKGGTQTESESERTPKKKRVRRRVLQSDSDVEVSPPSESESPDSAEDKQKKEASNEKAKKKSRKRIRKRKGSSSSEDSLEEKRPKARRKRIKTADSDSDSDMDNSQETPGKSGRKNIRKVIKDKQVADDTKQAAKDEDERLRRIAERQKIYNEMYENRLAGEEKLEKLILDFDEKTKEPLVSVSEELVKRLKPHQAKGIKFMWDACFESLERIKTTKGSGCILAHCMGLGKTFQVVALSHTLLSHEETGVKTIMIVCPLSTVLNWVNEFKIWLEHVPDGDDIEIYELTRMKQNFERKYQLQRWQQTGGIMILGYEMFRNLSNPSKKIRKNIQEAFLQSLVDPGPDLVVCDEGHLLKNEDTALSKAMRRIRTLRRIVLTGTPLQNNLIEYHCMVQFVKPNLLGTKKEFSNRFENPITNGQFDDSTEYDVRLMKKRAHVLHKMLEGCVQRLDYSVLTPFLPPKQEYVIFVKLTEVQIKVYQHYLDNYARRHRGAGSSLFADFQALQRIWTHPLVMRMNAKKVELANEKKRLEDSDSEGSLRDFINDGSDDNSSDSNSSSDVRSVNGSNDEASTAPKRGTRANPVADEPEPVKPEEASADDLEWWSQYIKEEDYEDLRISSKLLILFSILKESHAIGDKVLVFSQSLYSLSLIEEFLQMIDDETQNGNEPEHLDKHSGSWSLGLDYFRLDGQSSTDNRRRWCDIFNKPSNTRARLFLISTRAGGLGINLTAANRVIIFDASWNPSHDVQSIFRIYRFGQKKPCYVYRLLASGTMEEKIYNRQVTKLSLSCRVVDEQQIERHYTNNALAELYQLEVIEPEQTLNLPKDRMIADIFLQHKGRVIAYHEHDSLLENQEGEELDEEERKQAWLEYEEEKKGVRVPLQNPYLNYQNDLIMQQQMNLMNAAQQYPITNPAMMLDFENLRQMISKDFPGVSEAQQQAMASRAVREMYDYVERQARNQNPLNMLNTGLGQNQFNNMFRQPNIGGGSNQASGINVGAINPTGLTITRTNVPGTSQGQPLHRQQNGQMDYGQVRPGVNAVNGTNFLMKQLAAPPIRPKPPLQSTVTNPINDDDIMEIPALPEKNPTSLPSASGDGGNNEK